MLEDYLIEGERIQCTLEVSKTLKVVATDQRVIRYEQHKKVEDFLDLSYGAIVSVGAHVVKKTRYWLIAAGIFFLVLCGLYGGAARIDEVTILLIGIGIALILGGIFSKKAKWRLVLLGNTIKEGLWMFEVSKPTKELSGLFNFIRIVRKNVNLHTVAPRTRALR